MWILKVFSQSKEEEEEEGAWIVVCVPKILNQNINGLTWITSRIELHGVVRIALANTQCSSYPTPTPSPLTLPLALLRLFLSTMCVVCIFWSISHIFSYVWTFKLNRLRPILSVLNSYLCCYYCCCRRRQC